VPEEFFLASTQQRLRKFPAKGARTLATLNHYALRSLDSYLVKNDRGDVNRDNRAFDDTYWRERNDAAFSDTSIKRHVPKLAVALRKLKSDPEIAELHKACVAAHCATRDRLMTMPVYQDLRTQLTAAPTTPPQEDAILAILDGA